MKTILVVDDDTNARRSVRYVLKSHGYRVIEAPSGEAALSCLRREPVDLVILDLVMPQMDGTAVCDQMKADAALSRIPVIIFTVVRGEVCRDWSRYMKADACMSKPFQIRELLAAIRGLLGGPADAPSLHSLAESA
ncbi:MAG: response regulator [Nitrospirota bacterium]